MAAKIKLPRLHKREGHERRVKVPTGIPAPTVRFFPICPENLRDAIDKIAVRYGKRSPQGWVHIYNVLTSQDKLVGGKLVEDQDLHEEPIKIHIIRSRKRGHYYGLSIGLVEDDREKMANILNIAKHLKGFDILRNGGELLIQCPIRNINWNNTHQIKHLLKEINGIITKALVDGIYGNSDKSFLFTITDGLSILY